MVLRIGILSRCDSYIAAKFNKGLCTQSIETVLKIFLKATYDPSHFMDLVEHSNEVQSTTLAGNSMVYVKPITSILRQH